MQEVLCELGKRIRSERRQKGFSQEGFAAECGLASHRNGVVGAGQNDSTIGHATSCLSASRAFCF
jgi:transcriptional regulator with XRE-family HTH domain